MSSTDLPFKSGIFLDIALSKIAEIKLQMLKNILSRKMVKEHYKTTRTRNQTTQKKEEQ